MNNAILSEYGTYFKYKKKFQIWKKNKNTVDRYIVCHFITKKWTKLMHTHGRKWQKLKKKIWGPYAKTCSKFFQTLMGGGYPMGLPHNKISKHLNQ